MKKCFIVLLTTTLLVLALTSCENFLGGAGFKTQIENTVAYNNAPSCTVLIKSESADQGAFLIDGEKTLKVGYDFELQFNLNIDDYKFGGIEAVSKTNTSKKRSEFVSIKKDSSKTDEDKGIYVYTVTLLKKTDDILIHPVCTKIPRITGIYPSDTNQTYPQDTTITITLTNL